MNTTSIPPTEEQHPRDLETETLAVFEMHGDAFLKGDIDKIMEHFDSRSVVITADGARHERLRRGDGRHWCAAHR